MKPLWLMGINVVAILPAYTEANFIANSVHQVKQHKNAGLIREVIVVDDGSTDDTARIAEKAGADKIIRLERNCGKATAVATGLKDVAKRYAPKKTIVLTFDAEISSISRKQLKQLIWPIVRRKNRVDMVIGSDNYTGIVWWLGGQRAIRLSALGGLLKNTIFWRNLLRVGYSLEKSLNHIIKRRTHADTNFKLTERGPRAGGQYYILSKELAEGGLYLSSRRMTAQWLAMARQKINALPKEERTTARRAQLRIAKRGEKSAAQRMLREARRAKIKARQIRYRITM